MLNFQDLLMRQYCFGGFGFKYLESTSSFKKLQDISYICVFNV